MIKTVPFYERISICYLTKNIEIPSILILDTIIDHATHKAFKKLIKGKKLKHLNSQIEDLVNHKDSKRFWDYPKSLKEGQNTSSNEHDIPVDKLFGHFQNLHSPMDLLSSSSDHNTLEEDISTLEETKAAYNF